MEFELGRSVSCFRFYVNKNSNIHTSSEFYFDFSLNFNQADVEMGDGGSSSNPLFKPEGGIGKKKIKKLIKLRKELRLVKRGKLKSKNGQKF